MPARILRGEFPILLRIVHPRGSKKYHKKHVDLSRFYYGRFLSLAVCFDQTAVVFTSHSVLQISGERLNHG